MPDYNMLFQGPNAGQSFADGFEHAQQRQQQNALLQGQMQRQQAQDARQGQQDHMAALEAHRENIIKGAQIIRQLKPQDDASWQQTLQIAQQAGIDISEVPPHYDPQYAQGVIGIADAFAPAKEQSQPNIAREVDYYRSIGRDDLAQQLLTNHANPMVPINNGDGTITLARPQAGGGPQMPAPGTVVADPRKQGGPTASAPSSNFP